MKSSDFGNNTASIIVAAIWCCAVCVIALLLFFYWNKDRELDHEEIDKPKAVQIKEDREYERSLWNSAFGKKIKEKWGAE